MALNCQSVAAILFISPHGSITTTITRNRLLQRRFHQPHILVRHHRRRRRKSFHRGSIHWLAIFGINDKGMRVTLLQKGAFYLENLQDERPTTQLTGLGIVSREIFARSPLEIVKGATFRNEPAFGGKSLPFWWRLP